MRTQEEIVAKVKNSKEMFDFTGDVIIPYLGFAYAKEFLKEGTKSNEWTPQPFERDVIVKEMATYMADYGIVKATDHRGLSANRSVNKMEAWAWLLGEDQLLKDIAAVPYENYGAPKLKVICKYMDFPWPTVDENATINQMADGEICERCACGDEEGCG